METMNVIISVSKRGRLEIRGCYADFGYAMSVGQELRQNEDNSISIANFGKSDEGVYCENPTVFQIGSQEIIKKVGS